ncbi:MAG: hypothetical protein QXD84_07080 [Thermoplasmata archaeon]
MTKVLLYAQPLEEGPRISRIALRKGEYKEGGGLLGGIALTDVGAAVWETLKRIYPEPSLDAIELPMGQSRWALRLTVSQLRILMSRRQIRALEGAPGSYIALELDGDKHAISKFLRTFLKNLRRPPWEIVFKADFKRATGKNSKDVAADWEPFARGISLEPVEPRAGGGVEGEVERLRTGAGEAVMEGGTAGAADAESAGGKGPAEGATAGKEAPPSPLELSMRSSLDFDGSGLILRVRAENRSTVSLEDLTVEARAFGSVQFDRPLSRISYLRPGEGLTISFTMRMEGGVGGVVGMSTSGGGVEGSGLPGGGGGATGGGAGAGELGGLANKGVAGDSAGAVPSSGGATGSGEGGANEEALAGSVWAEATFRAGERSGRARTEPRALRAAPPSLRPVNIEPSDWAARTSGLIKRDEELARAPVPAPEAFDALVERLKALGMFLLEPEVVRAGTGYRGRLRLFGEDARGRPHALAVDCAGDYSVSKITLHYYAESAELVVALRELAMGALQSGGGENSGRRGGFALGHRAHSDNDCIYRPPDVLD